MLGYINSLKLRVGLLVVGASAVGACSAAETPEDTQTGAETAAQADGAVAKPRAADAAAATKAAHEADVEVPGKPDSGPAAAPGAGGCATFDSSFAAIQALIFERHGCTAAACHGQSKVGGLDLRADVAWESLIDTDSSNSANKRVQPGAPTDSFLFQKLQAATEPGSVQVAGSPMPVGSDILSAKELDAVRLWIAKGAPKTGTVAEPTQGIDVGSLLDACLPAATPVKIKPLEPPAADVGIQFRLPPYLLKAGTETEHCTPFAFDFTDKVPAKYKDEARNVIYTNGSRVRQDPQSHHMVVWNPNQDLSSLVANDPDWSCQGGEHEGQRCDPKQGSADCGEGVCAGKTVPGTFCNGDSSALSEGGTPSLGSLASLFDLLLQNAGGLPGQIANTQTPQQYTPPLDGVYTEIPLRGVLWFNSHAFNLTEADTVLEARVNFEYANELRQEMRLMFDASHNNVADGTPPFTRKTYCAKTVVPQHYQLATLSGHTHRRGEHFWINNPKGVKIYDSFSYSDPKFEHFDPWLPFDAADEASRTLEYCATYNNGLTKDDKPDLSLVTRASRMPERTSCTPVACVAGKLTAACTTDSDCDSAPGKADGDCDACPIKAGPTTENEMFAMLPWYVLPPKP